LKFNLDPENKVDDKIIIDLLNRANLDDLLKKDPNGIYQEISENGANLSSGEK